MPYTIETINQLEANYKELCRYSIEIAERIDAATSKNWPTADICHFGSIEVLETTINVEFEHWDDGVNTLIVPIPIAALCVEDPTDIINETIAAIKAKEARELRERQQRAKEIDCKNEIKMLKELQAKYPDIKPS